MADQPGKDGRGHERIPFREHVLVDGTSCTSTDISEGGIFVSALQFFEEGGTVEVAIPFKNDQIVVRGHVKYSQMGIGAGIMFSNLTKDQKDRIAELITFLSDKKR